MLLESVNLKSLRLKQFGLIMILCFIISIRNGYSQRHDFANFTRYANQNKMISQSFKNGIKAVFLGNSITEGWTNLHPDFFIKNGYIGRGIGGQTSYQFLLRFREDVINLFPIIVIINAGINDIAENTGPYVEDYTFGNIVSMVELAQANKIEVVLTSVLPANRFRWNPQITDAPQKIKLLNERIKKYAEEHNIHYVDYYAAMVASDNLSLKPEYCVPEDGVHPVGSGYDVMEALVQPVIEEILSSCK